jgi:Icc-related predicted phosphoesterase
MQLVFITDLHGVHEYLPALLEREGGADVLLFGGDVTNFGGPAQAARLLEPLRQHFPRVLGVPGNVDQPSLAPWLEREQLSLHGRGEVVEDIGLFGCGASNPTPLKTPFELPEVELAQLLEQGRRAVRQQDVRIVVSHTPPYQTQADRLFTGKHVGSTAVRELLEKSRLALCLCGHIHESAAADEVAGALVVNPGPFSSGHYARVRVVDRRVEATRHHLALPRGKRVRAHARVAASKIAGFVKHRVRASKK